MNDEKDPRWVTETERASKLAMALIAVLPGKSSTLETLPGCFRPDTRVEVDDNGYHTLYDGSGTEEMVGSDADLEGFLFRTARDELEDRVRAEQPGRARTDIRRLVFGYLVAQLEALRPGWGARELEEQRRILEARPFDDDAGERMARYDALLEAGMPRDQAKKVSEKEFPPPLRAR